MTAANKFRFAGFLTFLFVVAAFYIFVPERFSDWVFVVSVLLFGASLGMMMYWRVGNDPATAAVGLALVLRPTLVLVSLAAVIFCLMDWRKSAMVADLLWLLDLVFYLVMISTTVEHIQALQLEHRVSDWYNQTDRRFKEIAVVLSGTPQEKDFEKLQEAFRLSNRLVCDNAREVEAQITEVLETLTDPQAFQAQAKILSDLIKQRDLLLREMINRKADR